MSAPRTFANTMRPKPVDFEASRVIFGSTDDSGVPRVITQKYVRAGSSHTISSTQTVFIDLSLSVTLANGRIPCPWWRLSRRVSESAEN